MAKTAAELVREARVRVENLTVDQVAAELEKGDVLLVDVREEAERRGEGAIPGAVHVPRGLIEFVADPSCPAWREGFQPDRRVILHCATGGRSALAIETLRLLGYTRAAHLDGGFSAWKAAGRPVERVPA
jgi:rhodanese-related sulfurtransferase